MNTEKKVQRSHGMRHMEGGWPKDVIESDAEYTSRVRKKICKTDAFTEEVNMHVGVGRYAVVSLTL